MWGAGVTTSTQTPNLGSKMTPRCHQWEEMGLPTHSFTQAGRIQEWVSTEPAAQISMNPPAAGKAELVQLGGLWTGGMRDKAEDLRKWKSS